MAARIVILTGERGVGKSTVCCKTVALARARGYTCGGIITLSRPNDIRDVLDVRSGDVRRLTIAPDEVEPDESVVVQGRFRFNPDTLSWGGDALTYATPCHLFVADELGPLELEQGQGWVKAFDVLRGNDFTLALAVVRIELLERTQLKLPAGSTTSLTVVPHNRDCLPGVLLEMLEKEDTGENEERIGGPPDVSISRL